ncbi:MAG: hypothetical protein QOI29_193 [Mycobacterium sp.]|nr:hypothetical protein [Mycobacterium sp.]
MKKGGPNDRSPAPPWLMRPPALNAGVSIVLLDLAVAVGRYVVTTALASTGGQPRP